VGGPGHAAHSRRIRGNLSFGKKMKLKAGRMAPWSKASPSSGSEREGVAEQEKEPEAAQTAARSIRGNGRME